MNPSRHNPGVRAAASGGDGSGWQSMLVCVVLAAAVFAVFRPAWTFDFINYDDPTYVTQNARVHGGLTREGVAWAFGAMEANNWHPLTWISHMLDAQLFGAGAAGPHFVNVFLHVLNTILLFVALRRLTGAHYRSAMVAALFALHPLHVESVAWISERKDVLSALFFMLTLLAYERYTVRCRAGAPGRGVFYGLSMTFFALGLLCKPMLVTVPFVLLLLDVWPLRRVGFGAPGPALLRTLSGSDRAREGSATWMRILGEKLPFIGLSAASCVLTVIAQSKEIRFHSGLGFGQRLENAFVSCARYIGKAVWPENLAVFYPHPGHWPAGQVAASVALVLGATLAAVWYGRRFQFIALGWFWFVGMLIPVIGLVQVGSQSIADRYTYLPLIGLFILFVWGAAETMTRMRMARVFTAAAAGLLLLCSAIGARDQLLYWRDSGTLFRHAIAATENNPVAYKNLGAYLLERGLVTEAIDCFRKAASV